MTKPGNKVFAVLYLDTVVQKDIPALPKTMRTRIKNAIATRLAINPIGLGKPLRYSFIGHRRLRVGDYRIVYRIDMNTHEVIIVLIKHLKDVYEE